MKRRLILIALMVSASKLSAQVGVPPERSPFRDIENRMAVTFISGFFHGGEDPVGIAPQNGPYIGARYDIRFGSLISATGRGAFVATKRNVIDPGENEGERLIGTLSHPLAMLDAGLTVHLTGAKTFHNLLPELTLGLGAVSDFRSADESDYQFGTKFMFSAGAGVGLIIRPQWMLRADITNHMYRINYPATFYIDSDDGTQARTGDNSVYTHNLALTLGLSYRFFR